MLVVELALVGLHEGVLIGIAGLGFALIFRAARELNFAFGATIALGGYLTFSLVSAGVNLVLAIALAVLMCAGLGALLRYGLFRKVKADHGVLLLSFGVAAVMEAGFQLIYGAHDKVVSSPAMGTIVKIVPGTGLQARTIDIVGVLALITVVAILAGILKRTKSGLRLEAVIRDPGIAELVGINTEFVRVVAYAAGSALAGLAGSLIAVSAGVKPTLGFELLLYGFMATLLAGNRLLAVPLWGVGLGVALSISATWVPAQYQTLIVASLLVVFLIVRTTRMPRFG